jgi:hypothetical protein
MICLLIQHDNTAADDGDNDDNDDNGDGGGAL